MFRDYLRGFAVFLAAMLIGPAAEGVDGPGFPNIDYSPAQVGKVLSTNDPGKAISSTAMHRGYLFVPLGADNGGGQGAGAFAIYNVSNPASPVIVFDSRNDTARYHNSATLDYVGNWAEIHHLPISDDIMVISERRSGSAGFSIFDVGPFFDTDPNTHPRTISRYTFPDITSPSNYDGYSFALCWQGRRYVFAPTGSGGLFVIDTTDLANPVLLAHRTRAQLGNLTLRAAVPIGNLLILSTSAVEDTFDAIIMDISNPANPVQIGSFTGANGYQGFVYGSSFYGGGTPITRHNFSNPTNVITTIMQTNTGFDRPEYGFGHDGDIFIGHYPGATKWRLNGNTADFVTRVNSGIVDDHAFLNPLGNLVILCSDHNNNRKLMIGIHDAAHDSTPPQSMFTSPATNAVNVHTLSRVGVCFSDIIKATSVNTNTLIVRKVGTSFPVPGTYTTMFGIVNFVPDAPLELNSTYDVVLAAGGVQDQTGNAVPTDTLITRFSTGPTIQNYVVEVVTGAPVLVGAVANFSLNVTNETGFPLEHAWDFGDGTPLTAYSTNTANSHAYAAPGNFVVSVRTRIIGQIPFSVVSEVQVAHLPINPAPPANSSTIVYDNTFGRVWNVNPDNGTVTAINGTTYAKFGEYAVGQDPKSLALGPSSRLWVVNKKSATLSVLSRLNGALFATHALPYASAPHDIVIDSAANRAYVSLEALGQVVELDTATGTILRTVNTGPWPRGLALDPLRQKLWVSRFISTNDTGRVTAIDLVTFAVASTAQLAMVLTPDSLLNGRGLPNYVAAPALSPDLSQAYVPSKKDNILRGTLRDGLPLTFENTVRSMSANLDLTTGLENAARRIDFDNSDLATAAAFSPKGNYALFTTSGSAILWAVDAYAPMNRFSFGSGGLAPDGLVLNSNGTRLFVHNFMDRSVTVFDSTFVNGNGGSGAPQLAKTTTVAAEQLTPTVLRGKQLFYDTTDPRLAQEGYMSCASCHLDGGQDGRIWDFTGFGEGLRNTIDLNGRGVGHGPVHWTANFDEIQDFEGQLRGLSSGNGLMADVDFNSGTLSQPLGQSKAGFSSDLDALAAYVGSLTSAGKSPQRQTNGSLTAAATLGREIFRQQNCASCHSGTAFTDSHSFARHNVGTLLASSGQRLGAELTGLDTPTLRGLWKTAPYLHDGSAAALHDVLVAKNIGGLHGYLFSLNETEINQLAAYLGQIDDLEVSAPVNGVNAPPVLTNPPNQLTPVAQSFSLVLSASDPESDPLTFYSLGLPPGLMLDPNTGVISGAPGAVGQYTVHLGVQDSFGNSDETTITWTVSESFTTLLEGNFNQHRYVKFVADSSINNDAWTTIAEFNVVHTNGTLLNRSGWTITPDCEETVSENGRATRAIDGLTNTWWHTLYSVAVDPPHPHELKIDLGSAQPIGGFTLLPRQNNVNGRVKDWRFYWSDDGINWGSTVASGTFTNSIALKTVQFVVPIPGSITREYWTNLTGNGVATLTNSANFPDLPAGTIYPALFEGPTNFTNNYGTRMHGYLIPPASGNYTFWIASDDNSDLWLSSNHNPENGVRIARVTSWSNPQQWTKFASQTSAAIPLQAGVLYYICALHKNGNTPDNLAVAWQGPTLPGTNVIAGQYLMPFVPVTGNRSPVFSNAAPAFAVLENSSAGTAVGNVSASDPDLDAVTFAIAGGNSGAAFAIHPVTGAITVSGALNYESQDRYDLTIVAADDGVPQCTTAISVKILVNNQLESNEETIRMTLTQPGGVFPGHANPALIGFDKDPDLDGSVNAFEILFGMDPAVADVAPSIGLVTEQNGGTNYMAFQFAVNSEIADLLRVRVYGSSNLGTWTELVNPPIAISENGGWRTYRARDDEPLVDVESRFMRIGLSPSDAP